MGWNPVADEGPRSGLRVCLPAAASGCEPYLEHADDIASNNDAGVGECVEYGGLEVSDRFGFGGGLHYARREGDVEPVFRDGAELDERVAVVHEPLEHFSRESEALFEPALDVEHDGPNDFVGHVVLLSGPVTGGNWAADGLVSIQLPVR